VKSDINISVVLPIFNESGNLRELHRRLTEVLQPIGDHELIFVDDGSSDDSWSGICSLYTGDDGNGADIQGDQRVRGLRFDGNFGHHYALAAGMEAARGDVVVIMDADLQDPPEEIPVLLAGMDEGSDAVIGLKTHRSHSAVKRAFSRVYMLSVSLVARARGPLDSSLFRAMKAGFVRDALELVGPDLFLPTLFAAVGGRQVLKGIRHDPRFAGEPKYDLARMIRLAAAGFLSAAKVRRGTSRRQRDLYRISETVGRTREGDDGAP